MPCNEMFEWECGKTYEIMFKGFLKLTLTVTDVYSNGIATDKGFYSFMCIEKIK